MTRSCRSLALTTALKNYASITVSASFTTAQHDIEQEIVRHEDAAVSIGLELAARGSG